MWNVYSTLHCTIKNNLWKNNIFENEILGLGKSTLKGPLSGCYGDITQSSEFALISSDHLQFHDSLTKWIFTVCDMIECRAANKSHGEVCQPLLFSISCRFKTRSKLVNEKCVPPLEG